VGIHPATLQRYVTLERHWRQRQRWGIVVSAIIRSPFFQLPTGYKKIIILEGDDND